MRLAAIREGDIVRAAGMHALVVGKDRRALVVRGIGNGSTRRLRAEEVEAHWRAARSRVVSPGKTPA